jgi:hypothetical protein
MLLLFWLLLFFIAACVCLLVLALWQWNVYNRYRGSRAVTCPEIHRQVAVGFDALHAAVTDLNATKPDVRLADCTRWPERADCGQECVPEALRAEPYTQGEADLPKTKKIYHIPVVIAAAAAWVLGMLWHSESLFRARWMEALGLSVPSMRQIVEWWAPHLLSAAVPLLFAYGVAWLMERTGRKGLWAGILTSTLLWISLAVATLLSGSLTGISGDLLKLEAGYTFLASVAIGAIIGGLMGKLVESAFAEKRVASPSVS